MDCFTNSYEIPHSTIIEHRNEFYSLHKKRTESIEKWLDRVQNITESCRFGASRDFLIIDKFVCELYSDDIQILRNIRKWSLDELFVAVNANGLLSDDINNDAKSNGMDRINSNEEAFDIAVVKVEMVCFPVILE